MERPSHKELANKLRTAAALAIDGRWAPADPAKLMANFCELDLFLADEQRAALTAALSEVKPEHYRGSRPPQRSYEPLRRGAEMFAFAWEAQAMNCIQCRKANLSKKPGQIPGELRGERFTVTMEALVCPKCGYRTVDGPQMAEYMRLVADAYRSKHGLLTSEQIRARRRHLGMSQAAFAEYLGVGVASVKRWEMGKVQDRSSDKLIRLRADENEASRNLKRIRDTRKPWRQIHRALASETLRTALSGEPGKPAPASAKRRNRRG